MADLNALIAQGAQFQAPIDPFAQYAKMQQLQAGANQSALSQYQLESAKRQDLIQNALSNAYAKSTNPDTGEIDYAQVRKSLAMGGAGAQIPALEAARLAQATAALTQAKLAGEVEAQPTTLAAAKQKLLTDKLTLSRSYLDMVNPASPNAPAQFETWLKGNHNDPTIGPALEGRGITLDKSLAALNDAIAAGPQAFSDLINVAKLGVEKFTELNKPSIHTQDTGVGGQLTEVPGLGGAAKPVVGSQFIKQMSPYEQAMLPIHQGQLGVSQGQLGVARSNLGLHAVTADPFNLTGAQTAFPLANFGGGGGIRVPTNALTPSATVTAPAVNGLIPSTVTPPVAGTGRGGAPAAVATPVGTPPVPLSVAINQGLTGPDLLAAIPKAVAAQVTAITDHRAAPPQRNTTRGDQLMQLVNLVDPTYDATSYKTKQGIETAFTAGRPGTLLKSLNVVQDHLGTLTEVAKDLGNSEIPFVNAVGNKIAQWTGQPAPSSFAAVKTVVADELTKAILGTAGALGDRNAMKEEINAASSPAALSGVINKWQKLIAGQVNGLSDQYKSGGGNNPEIIKLFGKARASATAGAGAPAARGVDTSNPLLQ